MEKPDSRWVTRLKQGEVITINGARVSLDRAANLSVLTPDTHIITPDGHEIGTPIERVEGSFW